ncbi:hypothetical protein [Longimicrobium sp.]|jgi:hypothetical protein|uniref:hypothetical protein n=1 Tax=Longimicrobium sp. TaxID=2029185 RepID=UPI002ED9F332
MKKWLQENAEILPTGFDLTVTSRQLRSRLSKLGWNVDERETEVHVTPPGDHGRPVAASEPSTPTRRTGGARLDTRLESEGAEFLVLGRLLVERIPAYKTYTNMPGYDLVATNPELNTSARIQVKSRWRTNAPGFPIRNLDSDFVVFCRLNRGNKQGTGVLREPEYYVFPIEVVRAAPKSDGWSKLMVRDIPDAGQYRDRWDLIRDFLRQSTHG